jgi:putative aldouronate transport system permease protein
MNTYNFRGKAPVYQAIVYCLLVLILCVEIFPIIYIIMMSFATKQEIVTRGFFLIPREWTLNSYAYLIDNQNFMQAFRSSVIITTVGTVFSMAVTTLMAYGLSKTWLRGRKVLNFMVLFTLLFSGGIIPLYLLVMNLHLLNSYWSLFLTGAVIPFNLIVIRSFFQSFPAEIEESSRIDGCSEFGLLWRIVLPLSLPVIATFSIFYAVDYWNILMQFCI